MSLQNHMKSCIFWISLAILLLACVSTGCSGRVDDKSFFGQAGFNKEDVTEIRVDYYGASIALDEENQERLLLSLEKADSYTASCKNEVYPFTQSEYIVTFETKQGDYSLAMSWFDGGTYPADKQFTFLDRRFDVQIGEEWLTYQQDETVFWNENLMEDAYEKCANEQSITIPDPYANKGYDGVLQSDFPQHLGYEEAMDAETIFAQADLVVVGTMQGFAEEGEPYPSQVVILDEVLKGNAAVGEKITINTYFGEKEVNGRKLYNPAPKQAPLLEEGQQYLLCLKGDSVYYGPAYVGFDTAVIVQDTAYPNYNTEYHPFFSKSLEELRRINNR